MNIFAKWRAIIEALEVEMIRGERWFVVEVFREDSNNLSPAQTRIPDVILSCFSQHFWLVGIFATILLM